MKNSHRKSICFGAAALVFVPGQSLAQEFLTTDQIEALVVGKTVHAKHLKKGFEFVIYFDPDGKTAVRKQAGETTKTTYKIEADKHCIFWKGKDRCAGIFDNGDATYDRVNPNGVHIVKWTKIVPGEEL